MGGVSTDKAKRNRGYQNTFYNKPVGDDGKKQSYYINRAKVINRIKRKGAVPTSSSRKKYGLETEEINKILKENGHPEVRFDCLAINPRTKGGKDKQVCEDEGVNINKFDWRTLHDYMWMLKNTGRYIKSSKFSTYFGAVRSYKAGDVYRILTKAGCATMDTDIRPCLKETVKLVEANTELGGQLGVQLSRLGGLLVLWKSHPELKKMEADFQRLDAAWRKLNNKTEAKQIETKEAESLTVNYPEFAKLVFDKYGKDSEENLLMKMFQEAPTRFEILKLAVGGDSGNRINLPSGKGKIVSYTFEKYKTEAVFGKIEGRYSAPTSKLIVDYLKKNNKVKKLFTKPGFIKKMIDGTGIERTKTVNTGTINFLRKLYVSTYLEPKATADERERISLLMRHSPLTSLKYLREIIKQAIEIPDNTPTYQGDDK